MGVLLSWMGMDIVEWKVSINESFVYEIHVHVMQ